ncbi:uncharacterized protein FA14DRAFT_178196 [Meira miltonrushii]|uniref:Uncharacterized protein n=1 Tax=Meira miltonrushii TaxID=1280837 RepID=A0A316VAY0_9BASI|nr:uncharacterized protein FA14DRAFT_178196 [Meira miltonrushii]PWN34799.1 hypothetical protein FA14DRAFT_178196 [Meira miltonrushii]
MEGDTTADAMAAMGLPTSFSTPNASRTPPSGPSNPSARGNNAGFRGRGGSRGGQRGRDGGWRGQSRGGRGNARGHPYPHADRNEPSYSAEQGHPSSHTQRPQQGYGANGGRGGSRPNKNDNQRQRGTDMNAIMNEPLLPLEEVAPIIRPSFTIANPWAHLEKED